MALDSSEALQQLSATASKAGVTIGVLVEANVGQNRCGLEPGPALVALAREVERLPGVDLAGVQFYAGHIWLTRPDGPALFAESNKKVQQIREDFHREGIEIKILSGGSTPLIFHSHEMEGMNEIRPGTYIFNDLSEVAAGAATLDDCTVTIMATVMSAPRRGHALIDGGSKTFTSDGIPWSDDKTFGRVTEAPSARLYGLNEEHGYLDVSKAERELKVGDRVRVIPNHVCVTVNMQEKIYGIRGETVEHEWVVAARGKLR
jgi:D-serine deaminase-like pyridoxal phosphate-dependent protein